MDIATLRRANEALVDLEQVEWLIAREKEKITAAQADVSDMQEWVQKLEARIAGCKQTLMECGIAVPVTRVSRHEALRTLESEGQKWDEEARAKSGQLFLSTEQLGAIFGRNAPTASPQSGSAPQEHHGC